MASAISWIGEFLRSRLLGRLRPPPPAVAPHKPKPRRPKRLALMLMYSGGGFYGMQRQPDQQTIEGAILDSLLKGGWVTQEQRADPTMIWFGSASRTDTGVSAMAQLVNLSLDPTPPDLPQLTRDLNSHLPARIRVLDSVRVTGGFTGFRRVSYRTYAYLCPSFALTPEPRPSAFHYRVDPGRLRQLDNCLARYLGTHNFCNFTSHRQPDDPSCVRHIIDCRVHGPPVLYGGLEFLDIRVVGQSFMMHQIRRMIGLSICVVRGHLEPIAINAALRPELSRVLPPRAPGLGLRLENLHFEAYNRRHALTLGYPTLDWRRFEAEREAFLTEYLMPDLLRGETEGEGSMLDWVNWLPNSLSSAMTAMNPAPDASIISTPVQSD